MVSFTTVFVGSTVSALATGIGAVPILLLRDVTHRWRDALLALTAGIMMAASTFSLIPSALELSNLFVLCFGVLLGTISLTLLEQVVPHIDLEHTRMDIAMDTQSKLILAAITLHNIPEGLSVGVSYGSGQEGLGGMVALAIGLQNAPEGLLVALFLINQKVSRVTAFILATLTGTIEIVTSLLGYYLTSVVSGLVPYGLSFAAGAMLFIIYKELIPESHGDGNARLATFSFIAGLLVMVGLIEIFQ